MPSFASCSILRIAQFQTPVSWKSHVLSCPSWDTLRRSFSCLWIILYSFLVLDILFEDFQRRTAHGGDKVCVRPQQPVVDRRHYFRGGLCVPIVPAHYTRCLKRP